MADHDSCLRRYCFDDFTLDLERGALSRGGRELHLRPKSFEVLRYLVQHAGRLVEKQELMDAVWGRTVVTEGSLTQCIVDIRKVIGDHEQRVIRTIPRRGFIFERTVHEPRTEAPADAVRHEGSDPSANIPVAVIRADASPPNPRPRLALVAVLVLVLIAVAAPAGLRLTRPAPEGVIDTPPTISAKSVAVLRFVDLSPEGDHAWFADGLAEELLHLLAQSPELRVTARASSFAFPPGTTDVAEVARQLDVSHVVEGSVRRDGKALRVTVQLIDARTMAHLWSRTYDRSLARVLDVQHEIADDVASTLAVTLELPPVSASATAAEAEQLYLLGRHLFHRRGPGELAAAERYFERAVQLDPQHARAWTALAGAYHVRAIEELETPDYRLEDRRRALERALAIDPTLAEAHVRLGRYYSASGDHAAAAAAFERAQRLAPGDLLVLALMAHRAMLAGRLDESVDLASRVVALDPLSVTHRVNAGNLLMAAGRYEEALAELRRALALSPDSVKVRQDVATALLLLGRVEEARATIADAPSGSRTDQIVALVGEPDDARAAYQRLLSCAAARCRFWLAEVAARRGDTDAAFELLDAAGHIDSATGVRADFTLAEEAAVSPFLADLRADPRWRALASPVL
jgi:TolB-like protein/DNA-binding winged helix-turn-helix (wHTH) protein/Tfp pilus assembly protein PilF